MKRLGNLSTDGMIHQNSFLPGVVYCIMQDNESNIWLGIKGEGLLKLSKKEGANKWDVIHFRRREDDLYSLNDNRVYSIYQDKKGRIWIGTYGGGLNLLATSSEGKTIFINYRNNLKNYPVESCNRIRFITEDEMGHLCIGSTGGLLMLSLNFRLPENIVFRHFARIPGKKESLSNNDVHGICITKKGDMYIATFGGGINKVVSRDKNGYPVRFKSYTISDGLQSDITLAIMEDNKGILWISSENNLTKFNPEKETFETFAEIKRFMKVNNFSEASTCRLKNGEMFFGFTGGLLSFKPEEIKKNTYKPYISFSNFQLFNKVVPIGEKSPLYKSIDDVTHLELKHKQNYLSIEFAALDYEEPEYIQYAYKLEGFDEEWKYSQKQRVANYTNLPKGEYVFCVKSTNSEGVWLGNERRLPIKVNPSFWETPFAWILYFIFFAMLVFLCLYILIKIYRLEANVKLEKKLSEMKIRFLTDISHEIRTPLTMVTAPVEYMMNDDRTPEDVKKQLQIISHSTNRILRLVNQILDFRKIQFLRLRVVETELATFVMDIFNNFTEIAESQNINYQFINKAIGEKIWVDRDCLEKIVMNLLSNAFKYTPSGGTIKVFVVDEDKYISIKVSDDGPGISKEKQKSLFIRFSSFNEDKSKPSTGIGLSMVKDLADKHSAKVSVESEIGKGSCFTVSFLTGFSHFEKKTIDMAASDGSYEQNQEISGENDKVPGMNNAKEFIKKKNNNGRQTVLIVEDDNDLRSFLITILSKDYNIIEATDGADGLKKCKENLPDFIISDIMMPNMDGIELLQNIRGDIDTSHIPVILLTAKTNIESKLEGLSYGADDYITKPFSVQYFKARIDNLLMQRKRLQDIFSSNLSTGFHEFDPKPFLITSQDEMLMQKAVQVIENNIDNSNFTVEEFGQAVGMSRSSFYNKVKSLTGFSPVEFIRDIRLKRAKQLLETKQLLIKEVAFMTGFSDTKYFGECFKNKYGMTPMEYKNKRKEPE
jgi:signal transduction histidine kinase/DNA-binding response OmpR family regulator